jgi:hypothetical protein
LWTGVLAKWSAYCPQIMARSISSGPGRSFIRKIREFSVLGVARNTSFRSGQSILRYPNFRKAGTLLKIWDSFSLRRRFFSCEPQVGILYRSDGMKLVTGVCRAGAQFLADVCQAKPSGSGSPAWWHSMRPQLFNLKSSFYIHQPLHILGPL